MKKICYCLVVVFATTCLSGCLAKGPLTGWTWDITHNDEEGLKVKKVDPTDK